MELPRDFISKQNKEFSLITGNGTTAIFLALRALGLKNKMIGIPSNLCYNVPLAILQSGNTPVAIDIELESYGINPSLLKEIELDCIIAVHTFGIPCKIEEIKNHCLVSNIPLIEDLAQCGFWDDTITPIGSFGDFSIGSFGSGKVIDIGHGGYLLWNDSRFSNQIIKEYNLLDRYDKSFDIEVEQTSKLMTTLYNKYYHSNHEKIYAPFIEGINLSRNHHFYKFDSSFYDEILSQIDHLEIRSITRDKKINEFQNLIIKQKLKIINHFHKPSGFRLWRGTLLIQNNFSILQRCIKKNINASTWFPQWSLFLKPTNDSKNFPNANYFDKHIFNYWIDETSNTKYLNAIIEEIAQEA